MPQFKVAKTDVKSKLTNKARKEDTLYLYKETNKIGRLYYDFDDGTRIEIGALENVYSYIGTSTSDTITTNISNLRKYLASTLSTVDINELQINSFVTSSKSLYNIREINRSAKTVTLRKIYSQQDLTWHDYY